MNPARFAAPIPRRPTLADRMRDRPRAWVQSTVDIDRIAEVNTAIADALRRLQDCTPGDAGAMTQIRFSLERAQAAMRDLERPIAPACRLVAAK